MEVIVSAAVSSDGYLDDCTPAGSYCLARRIGPRYTGSEPGAMPFL